MPNASPAVSVLHPSELTVFLSWALPAAHTALLCPGHGVKAEYRNAEIPECQSTERMKRLNTGTPKRRNAEVPECRKTGMAGNLFLPRPPSGSPALTIIRTTVRVNLFYTKKFNFSAKLIIWRKNGEKNRAHAARCPLPGNDGCNIRPTPGDEYPCLRKTHRYRPTFPGN